MKEIIGSVIGNKYRIQSKIGEGGFGNVYLVRDENIGNFYAAKAFEGREDAFQREINNLKRVRTRGIPRLVDGFCEEGRRWIIMEYVEGISLQQLMAKNGKFPEEERIRILDSLAGLLGYLHGLSNPIIYGDLKPENILLDKEGYVNLIDMGSARNIKETGEDIDLTYPFAAPEQKEGRLLTQSDIYGFGEIGFYLLKGKPAGSYGGEMTARRLINLGFSKREAKLLERCLKKNPKERFQDGKELLKARRKKKPGFGKFIGKIPDFMIAVLELFGIMLTAYAMEQWFYEGHMEGKCLFAAGVGILLMVYLYQKFIRKRRKSLRYEMETELILSDTPELRLGVFILITAVSLYVNRYRQNLWVELYDESNLPLLIKEGSVYEADGDLTYVIKDETMELSLNGGRFERLKEGENRLAVRNMKNGEICVMEFRDGRMGKNLQSGLTVRIKRRDEKEGGN